MILIENQEQYANEPIVITARNFVDPTEVIAGLINKGQQMYQTGRGVVDTIGGANVNTNIGGYDVTVSRNTEPETKIMGISKPIFYTGVVAIGALAIIGVVYVIKKRKKNK